MIKRVTAPLAGGLATSFIMELLVYPAIYLLWKWAKEVRPSLVSGKPIVLAKSSAHAHAF